MYRDLTENKPPLGYWLYALAVLIGGYNELAIRLLPIPAVLLSIALVWWIGGRLAGSLAGVPGRRAIRPAQHRSLPVRQRIEHGTFHEPVLGRVAGAS